MIVFPNAKINIGLHIIGKRPDGYHNIETVFYPIGLADILEVIENKDSNGNVIEFSSSGISIPGDTADNLCIKMYHRIKQDYQLPNLKIHLHKIIPVGAGLGGGSSDAAFFIKVLDELFQLDLSNEKKLFYAQFAGSDCSFFIENKTAYAEGRGEKLSPLIVELKGYYLILLNPGNHISTVEAYSGAVPKNPDKSLKQLINEVNCLEWKELIKNDFEAHIFTKYNKLSRLKEGLYAAGAIYASMSGSGSSIYGIFKDKPQLEPELSKYIIWEELL